MPSGSDKNKVVFVQRDADRKIISVSAIASDTHREACAAESPALRDFIEQIKGQGDTFLESDLSLIRVLDDLVEVLIHKDVIRLTDLPERVQAKLHARRSMRGSIRSLRLLDSDDD